VAKSITSIKDLVISVGYLWATVPILIIVCSAINSYIIKIDLQAAEASNQSKGLLELRVRQSKHEVWSRDNMLSISKSLSRIEGKLDSKK